MTFIIMGQEESPSEELASITDNDGRVEVELSWIREHKDWYQYVSTLRVNNQIIHNYILIR